MSVSATISDHRPAEHASPAIPARRPVAFTLAVISGYVVLGIAAFWPVLPGSSHRLFGTGSDSILAMWFLAWVPHALAHGLNPFFSHAIFAPKGVNLAQNTESPFLGLITTPFALFLGPVARANLLMVLAMPVSATAAFVVLRKWQVWGPAAALGGLIYGFSPYAMGENLGHLVLVFVPLPPLIALTVASILQRQGSPRRLGIQLGLLVTAQFLSEPEVMVSVTVVTAWALLCVAIRYRSRAAEVARASLQPVGIALGIAVALLAYPIWLMLAGPQHYTGTAQEIGNPYYNDLLSFVVPGSLQKVSLGMAAVGAHINSMTNPSEAGGYIGIPLLIIAVFFSWRSRRSPRMQLAVAVMLGAALLSLGPHLAVDGRLTPFPLPFLLIGHLPLVDNILACRFSLEVDACLAAVVAFGLDDIHRTPARAHQRGSSARRRGAIVLGVVTLLALVATQWPQWPFASQVVRVMPAQIRQAVPPGDPVAITYPYASPVYAQPMLWQAESGFAFSLTGGYSEHPGLGGGPNGFPNPMIPPELENFLYGQEGYNRYIPPEPITPELIASTRTALSNYDVRMVVVDRSVPGAGPVIDLFTRVLGEPQVSSSSFALWTSQHGPL